MKGVDLQSMAINTDSLPTPSNAISAFIKSIRLRRPDDAVFWATYLWQIAKERSRIQRRILYCCGEDNISVGVIERVSDWYGSPRKKSLESATEEILRICATRNWWAQPDGWEYIFAWRRAEVAPINFKHLDLEGLFAEMLSAIHSKAEGRGLAAFNAAYGRREFRPKMLADRLLEWSNLYGGQQSMRLASVFARDASAFWLDANVSGQAYYALIHGDFGEQYYPEITMDEVQQALAHAFDKLDAGECSIPSYALDGIHTRLGSEKRFSGVPKYMAGSCMAFQHYGRLSPEDEWLPRFMELPATV